MGGLYLWKTHVKINIEIQEIIIKDIPTVS